MVDLKKYAQYGSCSASLIFDRYTDEMQARNADFGLISEQGAIIKYAIESGLAEMFDAGYLNTQTDVYTAGKHIDLMQNY